MLTRCVTLLIVSVSCLFQVDAQVLHGRITDTSGAPLAFASVYVVELRQGTASNQEGFYEIILPEGTYNISYQFLGYSPVNVSLTVAGADVERDIILSEQYYEIPAVRVSASGKDPAYFIMRKAIGMAPFHLNRVSSYNAEVYLKGGGKIEKLPNLVKRQIKAEANDVQIVEGQYYFTESVNIITFTAPDKYVHHVMSSRTNIPASEGQASPLDYVEASFYQPVIVDMAISPLSPNAFSHYRFEFLGSTSQGDFVIDKIKVTPKRKSQQLFEGLLYIVEDLWAIHSLDLTNENMAGTVRVKQLYTPVEQGIWMPVSHEFLMDISILGVKAKASYTSAVKYIAVSPNLSLSNPPGYEITSVKDETPEVKTETQKKIEEILEKDELTAGDMARLSRLNERNTEKTEDKYSLEEKERTTLIVEEDALKKDSAYWAETRPIPLTEEEVRSLSTISATPGRLVKRDTTTISLSAGQKNEGRKKSSFNSVMKAAISGRRWQVSENTAIGFDGLLDLKSISFNTVDGLVYGTGMSFSTKAGDKGRLTIMPSLKYGFSREALMWSVTGNLLYNPMTSGTFFLRAGSFSNEFSTSGVDPLINTISSLLFRVNYMKLYNSTFATVGHRGDLANGLNLRISATFEKRGVLENTTSFSIFQPDRYYSLNVPVNPFVKGDVEGYKKYNIVNHTHVSGSAELTWTPRQHYRISSGTKVYTGSDYPTFYLQWKHGYNNNDTISGHYDMIRAVISKTTRFTILNELRWRVAGGGFVNRDNLQLQDMYFFNTQASPVLLNLSEDAFYLKEYYNISSPSFFAEAHVRYTNPFILLKRVPGISRTLMRENLSFATLWTPEYSVYSEAGYSLSEIFLMMEIGIYAGFRDITFDSFGLRIFLRIQ